MAGAIVIKTYYIYEWYNIDTNEVFYVGKGTGRRKGMISNRNPYFKHYYNKHNCDVRIVKDEIEDENYAYELEVKLIAEYKSRGECFTNITDGGESPPTCYGERNGMYGRKRTEEERQKISESIKKGGKCKGKNNKQYGISPKDRMDEETYKRWIEKHKQSLSGINNPQYGISPYQRIPEDKIEIWKKNISKSCSGELNGNAKMVRMYNENLSINFSMIQACANYLCENNLTTNCLQTVTAKISKAMLSGEIYLGFYFERIK